MAWQMAADPDLWPALVSVALTLVLGLYSWNRRSVRGARAFAVGCLFALLWGIGTCLEIASLDFAAKVFWVRFHALWQIPMVTALSWFFLQYAGLGRFLTRRTLVLFSLPALLVVSLMLTNDLHHWIWTSFSMDAHIVARYGVATWASIWYANLLGIVNLVALIRLAVRSPRFWQPVALMLVGQLTGRVMYLLDSVNGRIFTPGESVLVVIGLSCSVYAYALFHFRVLDPVPLARTVATEQMGDGLLVLDPQGRIVDANPAATRILDRTGAGLRGREAAEALPPEAGVETKDGRLALGKSEIRLGEGPSARYYDASLAPLTDRRGEELGHLLLLHDVTGPRHSQEFLLEQQRVVATLQERDRLAREMHDSIGQVLGHISLQAQAARQWTAAGNPGKAAEILDRVADVAQEAHADVRETILSLRTGSTDEWTFLHALRKYLDLYRSSYGIETALHLPDGLAEDVLRPEAGVQVMRVIQEALNNARRHGGAHRVDVAFERGDGRVGIRIADDGAGFDPDRPTPQADAHFGLAIMRERMERIGGALRIESRPGSGTAVVLDVPLET